MKRTGKIAICLAGGLLLSASMRADNLYNPIATRNVFGLNPPQEDETITDPPPKITPNGIMSISGHLQVLFKVAGTGKPGQPSKDQSYILSEGQRKDDIEVMHIDEKVNLVTFNNHGTVQEIPLVSAPAVTGSGGGGQGGQGSRPNFPRATGGGGGGGNMNVIGNSSGGGGLGRQNRGQGNNASQNPGMSAQNMPGTTMGGGTILQSVPTRTGASTSMDAPTPTGPPTPQQLQRTQPNLSPEEQMVLMLAQRLKAQQEGNPMAKIFPPTPLDAEAGITPPSPPK